MTKSISGTAQFHFPRAIADDRTAPSSTVQEEVVDFIAVLREAVTICVARSSLGNDPRSVPLHLDLHESSELQADRAAVLESLVDLIDRMRMSVPHGCRLLIRTKREAQIQMVSMTISEQDHRTPIKDHPTSATYSPSAYVEPIQLGDLRGLLDGVPGESHTITLRLPLKPVAVHSCPRESFETRPGLRILVVDDDEAALNINSRLLQRDGHRITTAGDGIDGLNQFVTGSFDLILTDDVMPKMSGRKLARAAKKLRPNIPVIIATSYWSQRNRGGQVLEGVDFIISKPIAPEELRNAIRFFMPWHRR